MIWSVIYKIYPPILRFLEFCGFHRGRQAYHVGRIHDLGDLSTIKQHLKHEGFEDAVLAWKDSDELLNMRKVDNKKFQYHIRLFDDGEVRGHYEYSSEGNPWRHIREIGFTSSKKYFCEILNKWLT